MPFIPYSGGYLLNQIKGAVAAYSLRKLRAGVTNAIRVRRTLDSLEKDIGFSGMDLDTATLMEFTQPNLLDGSDSSSAYPNILLNPTMAIDSNSDGLADNWTHQIQTGITSTHAIEDNAQKISITASTNTNGTYITQSVSMTAGTVFATDWWYRVSGNVKATISLVYWNGGTYVNRTDALNLTANTWTNIKSLVNLTVPSTATLVECSLAINPLTAGDTGSIWVRNGTVKKCAYLTNIGTMSQDSNADGVADGWTTMLNANIPSSFAIENSLQRVNALSSSVVGSIGVYREFPCVEGDTFSLKCNYKISGTTVARIYVEWYNGTTLLSASTVVLGTSTIDSTLVNNNLVAPTTTNKARFVAFIRAGNIGDNGSGWFWDYKVQKQGSAYQTTGYDESGNTNNATQTTATSQPCLVANGVLQTAPYFDGTDDYFALSNPILLTDNTLFAVINCIDVATIRTIFGGASGCLQFRVSTSSKLEILKQGTLNIGSTTVNVPLNSICTVACSYSQTSGAYKFYINGVFVGSGTNLQTLTTGITKIGYGQPSEYFKGNIDMPFIYNRILSDNEILTLHKDAKKKYPSLP